MSNPKGPSTSRLDGKIALVTGSGRGMGRQNALELASRGASLVVNYSRASAPAEAVVKEIEALGSRAIAIAADVTKPAEIASLFEKAVQHYGKLDIVVSNSGVESFGHISEITPEEFDRVFSVNTKGQLLVAQQAYKHLQNGGRLVRGFPVVSPTFITSEVTTATKSQIWNEVTKLEKNSMGVLC